MVLSSVKIVGNMKNFIFRALESTLLRILEFEPEISLSNAVDMVVESLGEENSNILEKTEAKKILYKICDRQVKRGVINPLWLASKEIYHQFFLLNAEPEWLGDLINSISERKVGISQYIMYGHWDSLLILIGTPEEAKQQIQEISQIVHHEEIVHFSSREIPYIYRYPSKPLDFDIGSIGTGTINAIALDYNNKSFSRDLEFLEEKGVLLGPLWQSKDLSKERIIAFTGISLRGLDDISGSELLELLLKDEALSKVLVHLFKVDNARPFDFFAKLSCENMEELDQATNAIGLTKLGRIRLESYTMLASTGVDQLHLDQSPSIQKVGRRPQVEDLQFLAKEIITPYGDNAVQTFNEIDSRRKLSILAALQDFQLQLEDATWDPDWTGRIKRSVEIFANSVLRDSKQIHLTGAVSEVTSAVEGAFKRALRVLAEQVYGKDYAKAQMELKLPTKDFRRLSLGKCANAFRQMKKSEEFNAVANKLTDEWLERIENFAEERNVWAHDAATAISEENLIDRAHQVILEGMELSRWIHTKLLTASEELAKGTGVGKIILPNKPTDREPGFFISYSSEDRNIASRIANSLRAVEYKIWYDEWEIKHGDSIASKIESGLANNDTLLVLLSPSSVASKWVQKELNSALMRQLDGHNVKIFPILIKDCTIPQILIDIRYVDLQQSFQDGIIQLMSTLAERKKEISSAHDQ